MKKSAVFLILLTMLPASSQAKELVGIYGDWGAFKQGRSCYVASAPQTVAAGRSGAQLVVTRWARDDIQVMVSAGADVRSLSLRAGAGRFSLQSRGGDAWMADAKGDAAVLAALGAASTASVEGRTARGNRVADTYPLAGFSDAWTAAQKACR